MRRERVKDIHGDVQSREDDKCKHGGSIWNKFWGMSWEVTNRPSPILA